MPDKEIRNFVFTDQETNLIISIKRALSGDYSLPLTGIKTHIITEDLGILKENSCYASDTGFTAFDKPVDTQKLNLLKKKVSTLLLLITNMEMQKQNISKSFSADEIEKFCLQNSFEPHQVLKIKNFFHLEELTLLRKLSAVKSEYLKRVDKMTTELEVDQFYKEIRDTVVMGSYVSVNKVKEDF